MCYKWITCEYHNKCCMGKFPYIQPEENYQQICTRLAQMVALSGQELSQQWQITHQAEKAAA